MSILRRLVVAVVMLAGFAGVARAQAGDWDPGRVELNRKDLQELLAKYDATAKSGAYSSELRDRARTEAGLIRARLQDGDFQVGDRVALTVEGQKMFTDTFTVAPGRRLILPEIGDIPLSGVLRSELETYLTQQIAHYVVNPVVHARSLVRMSILGSVGRPGFYVVPAEALVSDALMMAGGPTPGSDLDELRIERADKEIWGGDRLAEAMRDGRTLDQLSLRAGDEIFLPPHKGSSWLGAMKFVAVPLTTGLIYYFLRRR